MAIQNSFDTVINRKFQVSHLLTEIKKSHLVNTAHKLSDNIICVTDEDNGVGPLPHPLYDPASDVVYIDVRGQAKVTQFGELKLPESLDVDLLVTRAKLELAWTRLPRNDVYKAFGFSNEMFVRWLTQLISHRMGLHAGQQQELLVVTALYSIGLFYDTIEDPALITRYLRVVSQTYYVDMESVIAIAEKMTVRFPRNLGEYLESLRALELSPRLRDLTPLMIYNLIGGSWFMTANPNAVVGLALEYPPAFAAMVYMATKYRLFKKTGIGTIVDKANRKQNFENYTHALRVLIESVPEKPQPGKFHVGFESADLPAFLREEFAMEAFDLKSLMVAGGIGIILALVVKFIQWVAGNSGSGGGGGGSYSSSIAPVETKVKEQTVEIRSAVKEVSSAGTPAVVTAAEASLPERSTNSVKVVNTAEGHFNGEQLVAVIVIISHSRIGPEEALRRCIEIDKHTNLFKDGFYVYADMIVNGKLTPEIILALSLATDEGINGLGDLYKAFKTQWDEIVDQISKMSAAIDEKGNELTSKVVGFMNALRDGNLQLAGGINQLEAHFKITADNSGEWADIFKGEEGKLLHSFTRGDGIVTNAKRIFEYRDMFKETVAGSEAHVNTLTRHVHNSELSPELRANIVAIKAHLQQTFKGIAKAYSTIMKACVNYETYVNNLAEHGDSFTKKLNSLSNKVK